MGALILKTAWRSLWRHSRRTAITLSAIAFGLALAVFFMAFADGVYRQMIDSAVRLYGGHFSIEHQDYRDAPAVDLVVSDIPSLRRRMEAHPAVETTKALILGQGVVQSAEGAVGVAVIGIEPDRERVTSPIARKVVDGAYLETTDARGVLVGAKLAQRLRTGVGKKLVITTNNAQGELVSELLRVKGVFRLGADEVDAYTVQVPVALARRIYNLRDDQATQFGVVLRDARDRTGAMADARSSVAAPHALRTWEETLPDLAAYVRVDRGSNLIFQGIIVFLCLFTVFNTLLMSVLERTRELALQLALGASPRVLQAQVIVEAALLGILGAGLGTAIGGIAGYAMERHGLDITRFYKGGIEVSGFAIDPLVYADVTPQLMGGMAGAVLLATLCLSIIPVRQIPRIAIADVLR